MFSLRRRVRYYGNMTLFRLWLRPRRSVPTTLLGTGYGAWNVPIQLLDVPSVCFCGGVGEDTQLDEGLMDLGHDVYGFDPTPKAIRHAATVVEKWEQYKFSPMGMWTEDTEVRFFVPKDASHSSHSMMNLQETEDFILAPVRRMSTLMEEQGVTAVDFLKLDIEGAEHDVLRDLAAGDLRPKVLCVEFDQPAPLSKVKATCRALQSAGYVAIKLARWDVTFVSSDLI